MVERTTTSVPVPLAQAVTSIIDILVDGDQQHEGVSQILAEFGAAQWWI